MLRQRLCSIAARLALVVWLATFRFLPSHVPGTTASPVIGLLRPLNKRLESHLSRPTLNGSHLVITGPPTAKTASGAVPIRRDIKDLHDNYPDQFNLYILGLREFYAVDENDDYSFYRVAGIHGRPFGPWQGAQGIQGKDAGFCPHGIILFLTWHRAYLLLYEQLLHKHVQNVAWAFPQGPIRDRYIAAAQDFRIPYWDWAVLLDDATRPIPTYIAEDEEIAITATDGTQQFVQNPLHHFEFHPCEPVPGSFEGKWAHQTKTLRHPSSDASDAHSRPSVLYSHYAARNAQLHNDVGADMLRNESFNSYSKNHLEITHNLVHNVAGGGMDEDEDRFWGHINPLEYSAFDPIFWLHHTNVDRLLSIYQALHPSLWLAPDPVYSSGTYAIPDYSTVDASTPLSPFWKSAHDVFYTSDDLRDTLPLGYAYPETRSWLHGENGTNGTRFREAVRKEVSRLYSPDWRAKVQGAGTTRVAPSALLRRGRVSEWAVRISVARGALGASFSVSFFLQPTPGDRREVGRVALLMPEAAEVMMPGEGQGEMGGVVNSTVQLTGKLVDEVVAGRLANLSVHAVSGYLPGKLGWSVVASTGSQVEAAAMSGVAPKVMVVSSDVTVPVDLDAPLVYSGIWVEHPEIVVGGNVGV